MVHYLPRPLPDETLYSLLARTAMHRGAASAGGFTAELFGRRHTVSSFDLPGGLAALVARSNGRAGLDIDDVIDRLTLFPFYTAYASSSRRAEARVGMAGDMTGVHMRLGVTTFRIPPLRALRFCPACTADWEAAGIEWHWRRSHQLPGVPVCPDHGSVLRASRVSLDGGDRHTFVAAGRESCPPGAPEVVAGLGPASLDGLAALARAARSILEVPPPPAEAREHVDRYRTRLGEVGLMRSARKVDQAALEQRFISFWSDALSALPRVVTGTSPTGGWLMAMVRSPRGSAHPVCHLLLSLFLDALQVVDKPFGAGPWLCQNPLAAHRGTMAVETVEVMRHGTVRHGDFRCRCGYRYTRSLSPAGRIGPPRYRSYGPSLRSALVEMAAAGLSLRSAARRVGLDPKTLAREAVRLGVDAPWPKPRPRVVGRPRKAARPRRRPASAHAGHPRRGSASGRRRPGRDWSALDRSLREAAEKAISELRDLRPVVRVTWSEVERRITARGWIAKRRSKLPQATRVIRAAEEGLHVFRLRRLDAVLERPDARVGRTASDVLREAGLPHTWLPTVRAALSVFVLDRPSAGSV